jgi:hypothetical protein
VILVVEVVVVVMITAAVSVPVIIIMPVMNYENAALTYHKLRNPEIHNCKHFSIVF